MSREEFDQANKEFEDARNNGNPERKIRWAFDKSVKAKGQLLKLNATQAADLGVARFTVDTRDPNAVYALYGVEPGKVREATPGWLDRFAEFIQLPVVTVLLVVIAFTGLILELKVPGLTVPGIIAALCFILVFWAHSRFSGEVFMLAMLLFIMGLVLIGLEIFVLPGFGAPGIVGILLMFAGLGLVTFERVPQTGAEWGSFGMKMSTYMFAAIGSFVLAFTIARFLPRVPYANRMMLAPPTDAVSGSESVLPGGSEAASLLGAVGTANTPLRPAGVVRFADKFVDVVSDGGFIPAGSRVQVVAVEGTRIVVKEV
jgi:membrane-bound ClpP family serine protease